MSSARTISATRITAALTGVLAWAALVASPALARDAYVANYGSGSVSVIDTDTNAAVGTIPVGAGPRDIAVTPDGRFAYVTNETSGTLSVIDTQTKETAGSPIPVGQKPRGIAISPDGQTAWVANSGDGTLSAIDLQASTVSAPIAVGSEPDGIAVSPDGASVLVAQRSGDVSILSTATRALVATVPDSMAPAQVAVGPHGGRAFVTNSGSNSVTAFDPVGGKTAGTPISVGKEPDGITVTPSGAAAYATGFGDGTLTSINTQTNAPTTAIAGLNGPEGVALNPSGSVGYVVNSSGGTVTAFNTTTNTPLASIPVGSSPSSIAIVPDQPPVASFVVTPALPVKGRRLTFNAGGSRDPDGTIASYAWDFGDGKHVKGPSTTRVHRYTKPGTYHVTLVTTDNEGCSTHFLFTGQTAACNGSAVASSSGTIVVADNKGPTLNLAGARRQRLRGRVVVFAQCPLETCRVRAGGTIVTTRMRGKRPVSGKRRIGRTRASLVAGQWGRLAVRISRTSRRAVLRALRSGGAAGAQLRVTAANASGLRSNRSRYVMLARARRHGRR